LWCSDSVIYNLAHLPASGVICRAELQAPGAATVARYDTMFVSSLYVCVKGLTGGHVPECGRGRGERLPALGAHYYLAELASRHGRSGPERAALIPGDDTVQVGLFDVAIKQVGGRHVAEG